MHIWPGAFFFFHRCEVFCKSLNCKWKVYETIKHNSLIITNTKTNYCEFGTKCGCIRVEQMQESSQFLIQEIDAVYKLHIGRAWSNLNLCKGWNNTKCEKPSHGPCEFSGFGSGWSHHMPNCQISTKIFTGVQLSMFTFKLSL